MMKYELWLEEDETQTFCPADKHGDSARALLSPNASLKLEIEAESYNAAMSEYYAHMGWGEYTVIQ